MTKIDIISGFLGAGKTTLIKKLLAEPLKGTKVVLIENEFGEIGIDGGFLKNSGIEVREMNSGCICCSLVGDFGTSLHEVMDKYAPERILIEPSGVGKLSDVMRAVKNVTDTVPDMELNSAVAVVDCIKARVYIKNFGEFFTNQIENAGTVLLTRTDKADIKKIEEAVAMIRKLNGKAAIITTPLSEIDGQEILNTMEGNNDLAAELLRTVMQESHHEHHHHHHEHHEEEGIADKDGVIIHHVHHDEDEHDHDEHCHDEHDHDEHCHDEHDHDEHCHDEHDHDEHDHDEHDHDEHDHDEHCHDEHDHDEHDHDEHCHEGHDHEGHDHEEHKHCEHNCEHDADEVFSSWGMETPEKYSEADIKRMLGELEDSEKYGLILRTKGMVPSQDGSWIEFDYVPGETDIRKGSADITGKFCVIGSNLDEDNLERLFRNKRN